MRHRKGMSKRNDRMMTTKQKHRYMDYEKLDLPNPDVRYRHLDVMAIIKAKKAIVKQKNERKLIRRAKRV